MRKRPEFPNHIWSYDFVTDSTERGRQLRMLCVLAGLPLVRLGDLSEVLVPVLQRCNLLAERIQLRLHYLIVLKWIRQGRF